VDAQHDPLKARLQNVIARIAGQAQRQAIRMGQLQQHRNQRALQACSWRHGQWVKEKQLDDTRLGPAATYTVLTTMECMNTLNSENSFLGFLSKGDQSGGTMPRISVLSHGSIMRYTDQLIDPF